MHDLTLLALKYGNSIGAVLVEVCIVSLPVSIILPVLFGYKSLISALPVDGLPGTSKKQEQLNSHRYPNLGLETITCRIKA